MRLFDVGVAYVIASLVDANPFASLASRPRRWRGRDQFRPGLIPRVRRFFVDELKLEVVHGRGGLVFE
jgi:hypothetical protein